MISIRKLEIADSQKIVKWRNNNRVLPNLLNDVLINEEQQIEYFNKFVKSGLIHQFIITFNGFDCGTTFLKNIDRRKQEAELGIFIGEDDFIGKHISSEATKMIADYGFSQLNLNSIYLFVLVENYVALKTYSRVGFVQEDVVELKTNRGGLKKAIKMRLEKKTFDDLPKK